MHISDVRYKEEVKVMRYGCWGIGGGRGGWGYYGERSFLTKEEKITMLKEYKDDLGKEIKGIEERIKELSSTE
jgi:hypothetical protein